MADWFNSHAALFPFARPWPVNTETAFALDRFGLPCPPPFLEVGVGRLVCLVDHNQISQLTTGIDQTLVRGIIDHHALQVDSNSILLTLSA